MTNAIDRLLTALEQGTRVPDGTFSEDSVLDFTVPNWRFLTRGGQAITDRWLGWHGTPGRFEHVRREPIEGGELVEYTLTWDEPDGTHAVHHCHLLRLADDRIVFDTAFCGGQWGPAALAEMGADMGALA
jgi:hypothetical protein